MERRLSAALVATALPSVTLKVTPGGAQAEEPLPAEASEAVRVVPLPALAADEGHGSLFGDDAPWPTDEAGESSFLADARNRGESLVPLRSAMPKEEAEADTAPLPPLDDLVQRIPAEVRDLLEELYRVKFTTVRRVPAKALK